MRGCKRRSNQIARHRRRATSLKDVRYAPFWQKGEHMNLIIQRLIRPRESTRLLFNQKQFSDVHSLFISFLGLCTFVLIPRLFDPSNPRPLADMTEILTTILFPAIILTVVLYALYAGILFLISRMASTGMSYREARLMAGGSFWIPMIPFAPFAFISILLTGGDHFSFTILRIMPLPIVSLLLFALLLWGLIIQIITISEHQATSLIRSSAIALFSSIALIIVTLGPIVIAYSIFS